MTSLLRRHTLLSTIILTIIGYGIVIGTLYSDGLNWIYPNISLQTVNLLSHVIAFNNGLATIGLILGWYWIVNGDVQKHSWAMIVSFSLILIFLVLYLVKTGGGGRKEFIGPNTAWWSYVSMLGIHILLSIISVPVVLYTLLLGLTHRIETIRKSMHPLVGRYAVSAWITSLILGIIAYVMLNHVYSFEFVPA